MTKKLEEEQIGVVYHGTDRSFNNFKTGQPSSSGVNSSGIFFTDSKEIAKGYGNRIIKARLQIEDWVEFDFHGQSTVYFDGKSRSPSDLTNHIALINQDMQKYGLDPDDDELLIDELEDAGWSIDTGLDIIDSIIMKNVDDSMSMFGGDIANHYVVFDTSQIEIIKE